MHMFLVELSECIDVFRALVVGCPVLYSLQCSSGDTELVWVFL